MWKYRTLPEEVYKYYIEDTKRGKNASKECVERKLLAMSLVAPVVKDNGVGCKRYQFGTFNFLVREGASEVGMVYWTQSPCFVPEENSKMLRELYAILGLAEDGQSIVSSIDETSLTTYCREHNLDNDTEYRCLIKEFFADIIETFA